MRNMGIACTKFSKIITFHLILDITLDCIIHFVCGFTCVHPSVHCSADKTLRIPRCDSVVRHAERFARFNRKLRAS